MNKIQLHISKVKTDILFPIHCYYRLKLHLPNPIFFLQMKDQSFNIAGTISTLQEQ